MNTQKTQASNPHNKDVSQGNKTSYPNDYLPGRALENPIQDENPMVRKNKSAPKAFLLGIVIITLAALLAGTIFLLMQAKQPSTAPSEMVPISMVESGKTFHRNVSTNHMCPNRLGGCYI